MGVTSIQGPGFLLKLDTDDAGTSPTTIGQVRDIKGPGVSVNMIDATTQDSPNGEAEKKPSVIDNGDITFDIVFDPANSTHNASAGLIYLMRNRLRRTAYLFTNPPTNSLKWSGHVYVSKFEPTAPFNGNETASVTLTFDGATLGPV